MPRVLASLAVALMLFLAGAATAGAQTWPTRPIRIIVPHAPGGVTDVIAHVSQPLGGARPAGHRREQAGRGGPGRHRDRGAGRARRLHAADVRRHQHDLSVDLKQAAARPGDELRAHHAARARLARAGRASVACRPTTCKELIAYAKAHPGELSYASPGTGSPQHLALRDHQDASGIDVTHIPYKGGGQAIADVVGGQVKLGMLGMAPALPHIKAGKLKALAVTGAKRVGRAARRADGGGIRLARLRDRPVAGHGRAGRHAAGGRSSACTTSWSRSCSSRRSRTSWRRSAWTTRPAPRPTSSAR